MKTLIVSLERNGVLVPVGSISGNNTSDSQFRYSEEYLHDPQAAALSISLPLQEQPYSPYQTRGLYSLNQELAGRVYSAPSLVL